MPDEIKELAWAPRVSLLNVFTQCSCPIYWAPWPDESGNYKNIRGEGAKRSVVDVGEK